MEEQTSQDAKVYHNTFFYFEHKGKSYRGKWQTVGYTYAGLRVWKKVKRKFILEFTDWERTIWDVLKHGSNQLVHAKRDHYNAIKTYDLCTAALDTTREHIPHTEKIIR
jgi:hypothetical protein